MISFVIISIVSICFSFASYSYSLSNASVTGTEAAGTSVVPASAAAAVCTDVVGAAFLVCFFFNEAGFFLFSLASFLEISSFNLTDKSSKAVFSATNLASV